MKNSSLHISKIGLLTVLLSIIGAFISVGYSPDSTEYYKLFYKQDILNKIESFLSLYIYIFQIFNLNYIFFLLSTIFFLITIKRFILKEFTGSNLNIFYFSSFFVLHDLIQIRLSIAICVYLYGCFLIHKKNKLLVGSFILMISLLTHFSLIVMLVPHFFIIRRLNYTYAFFIIFITLIILTQLPKGINLIPINSDYSFYRYLYQIKVVNLKWVISKVHLLILLNIVIFGFLYSGELKRSIIFSFLFGFCLSIPLGTLPVISSRLFELLIIPFPLVQTLIYQNLINQSIFLAYLYGSLSLVVNLYVFFWNVI